MNKENLDPEQCSSKDVSSKVVRDESVLANSSCKALDPSPKCSGPVLKGNLPYPPSDSDSDDDNDEAGRVRKALEKERALRDPTFDPWDKKYAKVRYTASGKPIVRKTKPFTVWAANTWGYLRKQNPTYKKAVAPDGGDSECNGSDELGLHTIAYPADIADIKKDLAKEMQATGEFKKSVNEVFRERYYIEIPYCRWCDTRPCACYV